MKFSTLDAVPVQTCRDKEPDLLGINRSVNMSNSLDQLDSKRNREQEEKREERSHLSTSCRVPGMIYGGIE